MAKDYKTAMIRRLKACIVVTNHNIDDPVDDVSKKDTHRKDVASLLDVLSDSCDILEGE